MPKAQSQRQTLQTSNCKSRSGPNNACLKQRMPLVLGLKREVGRVGTWFGRSEANGSLPAPVGMDVKEALRWSADKADAAGLPFRVMLASGVEWGRLKNARS